MAKIYQVKLTAEQRKLLQAMVNKGSTKAQRQRRARTLLLADAGRSDQAIAAALQIGRATVERTRRRFFEEGLEAARSRRKQRVRAGGPSSTVRPRRTWSPWPAPPRPRAMPAGRCGSWLTGPWSWRSLILPRF